MKNGSLFFTLTPLKEPWIYNDIYLAAETDPDIEIFTGSMEDALIENGGHMSREAMESFISKLTSEEIEARVHGKFRHMIGRVFPEFDDKHKVDKFFIPKDWPVWCAIDPHQRKPNTAVWIAISPEEKMYVCNEVYWKAGIEEFGTMVKDISAQYSMACTLIDTSSETPDWNRRETARKMLERVGVRTRLARKKNQKESSIMAIKQALQGKGDTADNEPRLYVFKNLKRTIFEFENYVYQDYSNPDTKGVSEEVMKVNDETVDCVRYILTERPRYKKPEILSV